MTERSTGDSERERVGRLIVDADLNEVGMGVLVDAINRSSGFEAERQTAMRIDVYRSLHTYGDNRCSACRINIPVEGERYCPECKDWLNEYGLENRHLHTDSDRT